MHIQQPLVVALKELEADLRHSGVSSCAIIYPHSPNVSDAVRRVYEALRDVGNLIHYSQNCVEMRYIEGTNYLLETISMARETVISTIAGKLVLPSGTKYRITSKR